MLSVHAFIAKEHMVGAASLAHIPQCHVGVQDAAVSGPNTEKLLRCSSSYPNNVDN